MYSIKILSESDIQKLFYGSGNCFKTKTISINFKDYSESAVKL